MYMYLTLELIIWGTSWTSLTVCVGPSGYVLTLRRKEIVLKIYEMISLPKLLYGSKNWPLTESQASRIQPTGMRILRHVAAYALQDLKRKIVGRTCIL